MLYLDADLFIAGIKQEDRFKLSAREFFKRYRGEELITSTITCLEVWWQVYNFKISVSPADIVRAISAICKVESFDVRDLESAAVLAEHHKLSPADSIHAILALKHGTIVSSDRSFDKVPMLKRLDFTKRQS